MLTGAISSDGNGLARLDELSRLLGAIRVGGLMMTRAITWVLVLAAHNGLRQRGDGEVLSWDIEEGSLSTSTRAQLGCLDDSHEPHCDRTRYPPPTISCQVSGRH